MTPTWFAGLLAQAPAADPSAVAIQSVWDFVVKGGIVMVPIGLCSLVALTVIVERTLSLRRRNIIPPGLLPGVRAALGDNGNGRDKALAFCQGQSSTLATIVAVAIKRLEEPVELLERHIQEAGERAVQGLRKHMRLLSVIASVAPLLGLLGTIFGMITAFQTVASSGDALGRAELLAKGIYEAMITTAAGLCVAIPTLVAYHVLSGRIESLVAEVDRLTLEFVEEYTLGRARDGGLAKRTPRAGQPAEQSDDGQVPEEILATA